MDTTFSYYTDSDTRQRVVNILATSYSIDALRIMRRCTKPFFLEYLPETRVDSSVMEWIRNAYRAGSGSGKKNFAELLGLIFCSAKNFGIYFGWLPETLRRIWEDVVRTNGLSTTKMNMRYNVSIPAINKPGFEMRPDSHPQLCFFQPELYFNTTLDFIEKIGAYFLYLPPLMRSLVIPLLHEESEYKLTPVATPPPALELMVYENDQKILTDLPLIKGAEQQGYIQLSMKGTVNLSTVMVMERKTQISEFFSSVINEVACLRGSLIMPLYIRYKFGSDPAEKPEEFVKRIFSTRLAADFCWYLPLLLHHLKGFRDLGRQGNPGAEQYFRIVRYLTGIPSGKWLGVDNLLMHCNYVNDDLTPLELAYLRKDYIRFRGEVLLRDEYYSRLTVPFVKAVCFLFAAFGLADIAYRPYSLSFDCFYEAVQYVRLTEFGEYVLGKRPSFKRSGNSEEKQYFEADEHNLIIRSLERNNIYEKLILDMAAPISSSRFKVTPISFLRSCKTAEDIQNKIDFFHQFVCAEPSPVWKEFFESVSRRINPLQEIRNNYRIFRLDPSNKELIHLIAQDPLIKKYVLKVENYHLLIRSQDFNRVVDRLKAYGYLL